MSVCYSCFREYDGEGAVCPFCGFNHVEDREKNPSTLPVGTILAGQYQVGKVLGRGGFGITYRAKNLKDGKFYAIKEYFPKELATRENNETQISAYNVETANGFQYGKNKFLQEAENLSHFSSSKNIVHVYSYFQENNTAYFAMEHLEGETFKDYLESRGGRIGWREALDVIVPILDALSEVHQSSLIHRDISPDNIFLNRDGTVKLIDFGAARHQTGEWSQSLSVILKHGYAPVEQYSRRGNQGPWTDIYAVSATLFRAITGELPPDAMERIDEDKILPPSAYNLPIPHNIEQALMKGLSVKAENRWQNASEFKKALLEKEPPPSPPSPPFPHWLIAAVIGVIMIGVLLFGFMKYRNSVSDQALPSKETSVSDTSTSDTSTSDTSTIVQSATEEEMESVTETVKEEKSEEISTVAGHVWTEGEIVNAMADVADFTWSWFYVCSHTDKSDTIQGPYFDTVWTYECINEPGIHTKADLIALARTKYTASVVDKLMSYREWIEKDGKLYISEPDGLGGPNVCSVYLDIVQDTSEQVTIDSLTYYEDESYDFYSEGTVHYIFDGDNWVFDEIQVLFGIHQLSVNSFKPLE